MSGTILHQYSDIKIIVPVTNNASGELIDAGNFSNIKYFITDILGCVRIKLSLGDGITVEDGKIIINIDDGMLDSSFKGLFSHQCIVWNLGGDKLPPIFKGQIKIEQAVHTNCS
ncbi:hypothetical protein EP12_06650 [Alteromonas australica]|mgnify:CR=1 FL=1|nr:hypothetical protein EP12_06650 [Alteromonas australica]